MKTQNPVNLKNPCLFTEPLKSLDIFPGNECFGRRRPWVDHSYSYLKRGHDMHVWREKGDIYNSVTLTEMFLKTSQTFIQDNIN